MNKPKVRNVFKKILAILICPFILTGCSLNDECNVEGRHVHKYVGKNSKGTITNYIDLDYFGNTERKCIEVGYFDGGYNRLHYYRTDEYIDLTKEDEEFYRAKGSILFKNIHLNLY